MSCNKFLKLSLATVLLGTSLSTTSWAMNPSQEDGNQRYPVRQERWQSISDYTESCRAYVESLKTQFPYSYYMGSIDDVSKMKSLSEEALYPYYLDHQEILDASLENLKKVFPHSYNLPKR